MNIQREVEQYSTNLYQNYRETAKAQARYGFYLLISMAVLVFVIIADIRTNSPLLISVRNSRYAASETRDGIKDLRAWLERYRRWLTLTEKYRSPEMLLATITMEETLRAIRHTVITWRDLTQEWIAEAEAHLGETFDIQLDNLPEIEEADFLSTTVLEGGATTLVKLNTWDARLVRATDILRDRESRLMPRPIEMPVVSIPIEHTYLLLLLPLVMVVVFSIWLRLLVRKKTLFKQYRLILEKEVAASKAEGVSSDMLVFPLPFETTSKALDVIDYHVTSAIKGVFLFSPLIILLLLDGLLVVRAVETPDLSTNYWPIIIVHLGLLLYLGNSLRSFFVRAAAIARKAIQPPAKQTWTDRASQFLLHRGRFGLISIYTICFLLQFLGWIFALAAFELTKSGITHFFAFRRGELSFFEPAWYEVAVAPVLAVICLYYGVRKFGTWLARASRTGSILVLVAAPLFPITLAVWLMENRQHMEWELLGASTVIFVILYFLFPRRSRN
jgi:hypothetical protein